MISFRVRAWEESQRRFSFYVVGDSSNRNTLREQQSDIDTALTPPGTQHGAKRGKPEKKTLWICGIRKSVQTPATPRLSLVMRLYTIRVRAQSSAAIP
jgi:hypothetical protein